LKPYVDGRVYREARSLTRAGHKVTIICWARTITNEMTSDQPAKEMYDGIKVKRIFSPIAPMGSSILRRVTQHLKAMKEIAAEIKKTRTDAVHFHDFNTLFVLRYLKNFKKPVVYDSHEDFINMLDDVLPVYMLWYARITERKLIKRADWAITIAEPVAESLRDYGAKKTVLVMNCRDLQDYRKVSVPKVKKLKKEIAPKKETIVLYIGSIGRDRGIKDLVDVFRMAAVNLKYRKKLKNTKLILGGMGHLEKRALECVRSMTNVEWVGYVPGDTLIEYNFASDIMVVLFNPARPSQARTLPNKLFEAMAARRPIIVCDDTESAKIVKKEKCGLTVPYGDKNALADAIVKLANDKNLRKELGKRGYEAAKREYNWSVQEKRLLDIYSEISKGSRARGPRSKARSTPPSVDQGT
jgi:glycosyltransferase involved in cell wall biosynthesis